MISLVQQNDMDAIYKLGSLLHDNFHSTNLYDNLVNNIDKTYKICLDNCVIGFIHVQIIVDEINIIDLVVDSAYRHQGYGTKLLNYVLNEYKGNRFILDVSSNNINAINFYKKEGFIPINIRKKYYPDNSDAFIMEKK